MFDLSFLNSIDFANPSNLLFLLIIFVSAIIILLMIFIFLRECGKIINKLIRKLFKTEHREAKPVTVQKTNFPVQEEETPKHKINSGDFVANTDLSKKEDLKPEVKDIVKIQSEADKKDIAEELSQLKGNSSEPEKSPVIKMPSLNNNGGKPDDKAPDMHEKIIIPVSKKIQSQDVYAKAQTPAGIANVSNVLLHEKSEQPVKNYSVLQKIDIVKKPREMASTQDKSIFKGALEVSRVKLEHEMKTDPEVWKAERQTGLNLSPVERAKLVHEVFSPVLGRNISKNDLKVSIKKLNQKLIGTSDATQHSKIRKEIKFFKKIGGIK